MNRRAIALLLAVAMTISLCVLSAFAAGQTEDGTACSLWAGEWFRE